MTRQYAGCEPWIFDGERWQSKRQGERRQIRSYKDLDVYNPSTGSGRRLAYTLAMEVFHLTARFPKEERYGLVDQMRRLS